MVPRSVDAFLEVVRGDGIAAALAWLNAGVPHRFSAIYRFEGALLRNEFFCDKKGAARPAFLLAVPFEVSFCQFALRDGAFRTDDSGTDDRLLGHPYRGVVVSYHSVPLTTLEGEIWGTLSHFDTEALHLDDEEFALLQAVARELPAFL
ncbi:MAG: GAF domain-containing protein [Variovorax sp.]|nr:GAF domain-containing protein [Variovorax sp.]